MQNYLYYYARNAILGMLMDRSEAIVYLKELLRNCTNMSPEAVSFEQTAGYKGFTIRIKGAVYETDKDTIRNIAKKHWLAVKEEQDQFLIFKPKKFS